MVDPDAGEAAHQGRDLAKVKPTSSEPTRPGPRVAAMRSISFSSTPACAQCLLYHRLDHFDVAARSQLGDNAAEPGMSFILAVVAEESEPVFRLSGRRCIVAGNFNGKDKHGQLVAISPFRWYQRVGISAGCCSSECRGPASYFLASTIPDETRNYQFAPHRNGLTDLFSRPISYLRLSLTDRCNLSACIASPRRNPAAGLAKLRHDDCSPTRNCCGWSGWRWPWGSPRSGSPAANRWCGAG